MTDKTTDKAQSTQDEDRTLNLNVADNSTENRPTQEEQRQQLMDADAKVNEKVLPDEALNDNELKAKINREELDKTNEEHKTDDFHTAEALREQEAYEHGQKVANEQNDKLDSNTKDGVDAK